MIAFLTEMENNPTLVLKANVLQPSTVSAAHRLFSSLCAPLI